MHPHTRWLAAAALALPIALAGATASAQPASTSDGLCTPKYTRAQPTASENSGINQTHPRARWPHSQRAFQCRQCFRTTAHLSDHGAIWRVLDKPSEPARLRLFPNKPAEADTLHATADHVLARVQTCRQRARPRSRTWAEQHDQRSGQRSRIAKLGVECGKVDLTAPHPTSKRFQRQRRRLVRVCTVACGRN